MLDDSAELEPPLYLDSGLGLVGWAGAVPLKQHRPLSPDALDHLLLVVRKMLRRLGLRASFLKAGI